LSQKQAEKIEGGDKLKAKSLISSFGIFFGRD
jgi:hypothetical protein